MDVSKQKLILVTGGAGFIGSHLCERLVKGGHKVISLDNYFAGSKDNHVEGVEYREGHTKDIEKLIPETPDIIYHLGEYSRVEQSVLEPEVVEDLNTIGTAAVIEFWKQRKSKLVYAGSSTKFGDNGKAREATPYARTKADNTERVKTVGEREKLSYAITYFYNVYGPRERSGMYGTVIEIFKQMYLSGAPLTVTTPGTQERNFTHVDDIVDGLIVVGEKGEGDEFGLGNSERFTILEVAHLFSSSVVMLPPREGNRMMSALDTTKSSSLGWRAQRTLREYIGAFISENHRAVTHDTRILIFSTTFYPTVGPAEEALITLMQKMPHVQFDVVTTAFDKRHFEVSALPVSNATVYRVGFGNRFDKFLLPILGARKARSLVKKHRYLFAWSLMASYATLAAIFSRRTKDLPLLVTLADQRITWYARLFLSFVLTGADQVYATIPSHEKYVERKTKQRSIGRGDDFANQIRFSYQSILAKTKV